MLQASCPVCVRSIQSKYKIIITKSKRILASRKTRKSRHQWQLLTTGFAEGYVGWCIQPIQVKVTGTPLSYIKKILKDNKNK